MNVWFEIRIKNNNPADFKVSKVIDYRTSVIKFFGEYEDRETAVLKKRFVTYLFHITRGKEDSFVEIYAYIHFQSFELIQVWDKKTFGISEFIIQDI